MDGCGESQRMVMEGGCRENFVEDGRGLWSVIEGHGGWSQRVTEGGHRGGL